jgi:hypothetical protein
MTFGPLAEDGNAIPMRRSQGSTISPVNTPSIAWASYNVPSVMEQPVNYANAGIPVVITVATAYGLVKDGKLLWSMGPTMRFACALSVIAFVPCWMLFLELPAVNELLLWTTGGCYGVSAALILLAAYPYLTGARR